MWQTCTVKMYTMSFVEIIHGNGNFALPSFHLELWKTISRFCLGRGCGKNVTRYKWFLDFISILFYMHLAIPAIPAAPNSMLCKCCDLRKRSLKNQHCLGGRREFFQGDRKPITLGFLLKNQSNCRLENGTVCCLTLFLSSKGYVTRKLPNRCRFRGFL